MKELSIEEKAKRYDELKVTAQELEHDGCFDKITLFDLFPELEESEDERIKRVIKQVLYESTTEKDECYLDNGVTQQEVFAWLEKQGEQKPTLDVEIPFGAKDSELEEVSYSIPNGYHAEIEDNKVVIKQGEQKPAEWHREDEQNLNACLGFIPDAYLCRWLKDVIHVKYDKPAWSEEDEKMYNAILRDVRNGEPLDKLQYDWLKSLRPQNKWKPSDEQIRILELAIDYWKPNDVSVTKPLYNLLEQLKKLREE